MINVPLPAGGFSLAAIPKGHAPVTAFTVNVPYWGAGRDEVNEGASRCSSLIEIAVDSNFLGDF